MNTAAIVVTIFQVIAAILLTVMVLLQSGKSEGLSGALVGSSSETFMGKNKSHTWDAKIAKATKWVAAVFIVLTFVLSLL
jgi:preprotein translocase subunit SecG